MIDWTVNLGNILTIAGAIAAIVVQSFYIGRFAATMTAEIKNLDARVERIESIEGKIGEAIVMIAQQRAEMGALTQRVDDVQKYGSHRLAEVLEAIRGQIMGDFRERFDFLQKQINRGSKE